MTDTNFFIDSCTKKILCYTIFLFALTSINIHILSTNLVFGQTPEQNVTQNTTGLKIVEPNMTLNTDDGGEVVNNELIILLNNHHKYRPLMHLF